MELGDLCDLIVDCEHKTAPTQEAGYPSIRTPNIGRGYLILDEVNRVSEETYRLWTRRAIPKPGDLIMAREAPAGNVAIIPRGLNPCLGQRTLLIRCNRAKADPYYLSYLLNGPLVQATIYGMTNGVTVPHLNMKDVRTLPIPEIPSLPTQRKIAAILSAYDDLIENNTRRIKILEEMAQALYREWFVHFRFPGHDKVKMVPSSLGPIPHGWELKPVGEVVETTGGSTPSTKNPDYWGDGNVIWFTPSDLTRAGSMYIRNSSKRITKLGLERSSARMFPPYSVMMTSRATIGVVAINTEEACTNQGFITCIPNMRLSAYQIYFWIDQNREQIINIASGATYKEINRTEFRELQILVADQGTNTQFVKLVGPLCKQIENCLARNINLRRTRDLLLPKLISGEVDVSNLE